MNTHKGLFVVMSGGEGSGKSSQLKNIQNAYGSSVLVTREPGGSLYAEEIRKIILDSKQAKQADATTMFFLFWAARADHMKNIIIPALNKGMLVVSDRFEPETFAYNIVAQKNRSLEKLYWEIRDMVLGDYKPDLYIYLDLHPKVGLLRKQNQIEEKKNHYDERDIGFHDDVRMGFMEFFSHKNRGINSVIVNAEKSQDEVWREVKKASQSLISYKTR